jgi:hypothetical protein
MRTARILLLAPLLLAPAVHAQPGQLVNAKTTVRAATPGHLTDDVRTGSGPRWVAWSVPSAQQGHICCYGSIREGEARGFCCGGCRLESGHAFVAQTPAGPAALESTNALVFVRLDGSRETSVRSFSSDCGVDAEGRDVVWLTGVSPEDSVRYLASLANGGRDSDLDDGLAGRALSAVALQATPAADRLLEGFLRAKGPLELRKKAAFWLGTARGRAGFEALAAVIPDDPDAELRHHGTFAISESHEPGASALLIRMARRDPDGEVRGQALFWLAQRAGEKAAESIQDAIRDDPDAEVKEKAVFALSQLPKDRAVTELIRVARTSRVPEVRERAIFWLGQTKDARALDYIEEILKR